MSKKTNTETTARGSDAIAFLNEICTPAEIAAAEMKARLLAALIDARAEKKLTQKRLAAACGLPQPSVARIESGASIPRIDTFCKIVASLGFDVVLRRRAVPAKRSRRASAARVPANA